MREHGHPLPTEDRIAFNAVYSAMSRRKETFFKTREAKWGLVKWGIPEEQSPNGLIDNIAEPFDSDSISTTSGASVIDDGSDI
jgi:hypothetical protein